MDGCGACDRNRRKDRQRVRLEDPLARAKKLISDARHRTRGTDVVVDLNPQVIAEIIERGTCEGSGLRFDLRQHHAYTSNPMAPSLDRKIPGGNYTHENVRVTTVAYNIAKGQYTVEELALLALAIVSKQQHQQ